MLTRILLGFIIAGIGFLITWKSEWLLHNFGRVQWAEENLGGGGSRLFFKLLGIAIIFIGYAIITNLMTSILESFVGLFVR